MAARRFDVGELGGQTYTKSEAAMVDNKAKEFNQVEFLQNQIAEFRRLNNELETELLNLYRRLNATDRSY